MIDEGLEGRLSSFFMGNRSRGNKLCPFYSLAVKLKLYNVCGTLDTLFPIIIKLYELRLDLDS